MRIDPVVVKQLRLAHSLLRLGRRRISDGQVDPGVRLIHCDHESQAVVDAKRCVDVVVEECGHILSELLERWPPRHEKTIGGGAAGAPQRIQCRIARRSICIEETAAARIPSHIRGRRLARAVCPDVVRFGSIRVEVDWLVQEACAQGRLQVQKLHTGADDAQILELRRDRFVRALVASHVGDVVEIGN